MAVQTAGKKRPPGRPRRGPDPERFRQIIDAAAELFRTKGYAATSIQDIGESIGILKGSLYHYVDSKEDFLYYIIRGVYAEAVEDIQRVLDFEAPAAEKLAAFVRTHVLFTTSHMTAYTVRLREFHNLNEERRREIRQDGEGYVSLLTSIIEQGRAEGVFETDTDLQLLIRVLLGTLNSITRWYRADGLMDPDELSQFMVASVVSSVITDEGVREYGGLQSLRARMQAIVI